MHNRYREARLRAERLLKDFRLEDKVAELKAIETKMADPASCMDVPPSMIQRHGELTAELAPMGVYQDTDGSPGLRRATT